MTPQAIADSISRQMGFRTDLEPHILAEMQIAQERLEKELFHTKPWFLLTEVETTEGCEDERLAVPADFLVEYEDGTLWIYDTVTDPTDPWIELHKDSYDILKARLIGTGRPQCYSLVGKYFRLHPTPDQEYFFKMIYYVQDVAISSLASEPNLWLTHVPGMIMARTGLKIAQSYYNAQREASFKEEYLEAMSSFHRENIHRRMQNYTPDEEI
jgi:hypothetical protein